MEKRLKVEWKKCPQFNWCYGCWFNANLESAETECGTMYICLNCALHVNDYGNNDGDMPRFFSDDEWKKFWEENYKSREFEDERR